MTDLEKGDGNYDIEKGYQIEKVVDGLSYPTSLEFGPDGALYFTEAGFTYPFIYKKSRILRLAPDGNKELVAEGFNGPLIGLKWHEDGFLATHRGTLSRVNLQGERTDLVTDLPSYGDHHTDHIAIKDNKVYFGQGTITNTGVVGSDNLTVFGWLVKHKDGHDTPAHDVVLTGKNYKSKDPFNPLRTVETGAFLPLGTPSAPGQIIKGELKANGVIYECNPDGTDLQVYAWGLRNPYGLTVDIEGRLLVLDQGADVRGSRPASGPEALYEVKPNAWYGWPDYLAGKPITELSDDKEIGLVLNKHPDLEEPLYTFENHSTATFMDFSRDEKFGYEGQAFVAQFGSEAPFTTGGKPVKAGRKVTRLDMKTMTEHDFFVSKTFGVIGDGPNRPVFVKFSPDGESLYIIDHGARTVPKSGAIWKIIKDK
jgi:glucose/arabinose dehydrogenase